MERNQNKEKVAIEWWTKSRRWWTLSVAYPAFLLSPSSLLQNLSLFGNPFLHTELCTSGDSDPPGCNCGLTGHGQSHSLCHRWVWERAQDSRKASREEASLLGLLQKRVSLPPKEVLSLFSPRYFVVWMRLLKVSCHSARMNTSDGRNNAGFVS